MTSIYKPGNIRRINIKDFLTYDEIEVKPTPHLNVIIGPNTTGKSSILCAICIGLGGKPEVTGRGKHISEYIKHGKDSSTIEIELHNAKGKHSVIRRKFNRSGKSNWTFNGRDVIQKTIEEGVKSMGIRVDNLCQFLPQDRVSQFARLNKVDLLLSTEKAVGETKLAEDHENLCSSAQLTLSIQVNLASLQKQLEVEVKKNDLIKVQVDNCYLKLNLEEKIKILKICKRIFQVEECRVQSRLLKTRQNELSTELKLLEQRMAPRQRDITNIDVSLKNILRECSRRLDCSRKREKDASQFESRFNDRNDAIENAIQSFANSKTAHAKNLQAIGDLKRQLIVMQQQLNESQQIDESKLASKIQDMTKEIQDVSRNLTAVTNEIEQKTLDLQQTSKRHCMKERELSALQNVKIRRLKLLTEPSGRNRKLTQNTYDATEWLQQNQNKFQCSIYGPVFCELDVLNKYARYVENAIPQRDLLAFVCENRNDVNTFKQIADQHHWTINIIHSNPDDPNLYQPQYPLDQLHKLGFDTYLRDVIRAPAAILSYLCKSCKLHNIPAALQGSSLGQVPYNIYTYYSGSQRFSKSRSRYDGQTSTAVDSIRNAFYLSISSNSEDFETIQNEKIQLEQKMRSFDEVRITLNNESLALESRLEDLRVKKRSLAEQKDERKQLEARVQQKKSQVNRRENSLEDVDGAEAKMKEAIKKCHIAMSEAIQSHCKMQDELKILATEDLKSTLSNLQYNQNRDQLMKEGEEEREALNSKKVEISKVEEDYQELRARAISLKNELLKSHKVKESEYLEMMRIAKKENLEEVEKELAEAEARRECLFMSVDETVMKEFSRREEDIKRLKSEVVEKETLIQNRGEAIEATKNRWIPKITELTARISDHFSNYMQQLDCAGQVLLEKGKDENDFSKYGLGIKVKFRDADKLSDLTVHQQSGGEKSVSTALYLLALQTLTAVPFRCVDEINQGMDATNERNMFSMLVESTSKDLASQYFLVTPKLLPNLPYNNRVNFMVVYNGKRMTSYEYCKGKKVLELYRRCR